MIVFVVCEPKKCSSSLLYDVRDLEFSAAKFSPEPAECRNKLAPNNNLAAGGGKVELPKILNRLPKA